MTVKTVTGRSKSDLDEIKTTVGKTFTVGESYEIRGDVIPGAE